MIAGRLLSSVVDFKDIQPTNQSPLENMHCCLAFQILKVELREDCNVRAVIRVNKRIYLISQASGRAITASQHTNTQLEGCNIFAQLGSEAYKEVHFLLYFHNVTQCTLAAHDLNRHRHWRLPVCLTIW